MGFGETTNRGRRFPVEILTGEEVRAMIALCSRRAASGVRDRALIAVMYRGGLRVSEALALMPKDVELASGAVSVLHGKGDKARVVAVDQETVTMIELWLAKRIAWGLTGKDPLFCTLYGGKIRREQVLRRLKALAARAGIEKRVHPHGLRHSRAVNLLENGVDVKTIQMALGHANLGTTDTYLSHIAPAKVVAAMREGKW